MSAQDVVTATVDSADVIVAGTNLPRITSGNEISDQTNEVRVELKS